MVTVRPRWRARLADVGAKVEPGMHRGAAQEWIGAHAEA